MNKIEQLRAIMRERTGGQYDGSIQTKNVDAPVKRTAPIVPAVAAPAIEDTQAAVVDEARSTRSENPALARIEALVGTVCAYDGRFCIWTTRDNGRTRDSFDIRDVARRAGLSPDTVADSLPEFKPVRRGRASVDSTESEGE